MKPKYTCYKQQYCHGSFRWWKTAIASHKIIITEMHKDLYEVGIYDVGEHYLYTQQEFTTAREAFQKAPFILVDFLFGVLAQAKKYLNG